MKMMLAENIRMFRKNRGLTQEQLAEVLGVTSGAVYKWEAKLSVPELSMIIEMADFFDASVDALLGYTMKDNRLSVTIKRLKEYRLNKEHIGLEEAEKALKRYPHTFEVVHESAVMYRVFGIERHEESLLRRALDLLDESCTLLPQNTDPTISELTLYGEMADVHLMLNESEKAVELLKLQNAGGHYNDRIGFVLANNQNLTEEAVPFLSMALLQSVTAIMRIIEGYVTVYCGRDDYHSAEALLQWGIGFILELTQPKKASFLEKILGRFHVLLAFTQIKTDSDNKALASLKKARSFALYYDDSTCPDMSNIRFVNLLDRVSAYDDLGNTALDSVNHAVSDFANEKLSSMWKMISGGNLSE